MPTKRANQGQLSLSLGPQQQGSPLDAGERVARQVREHDRWLSTHDGERAESQKRNKDVQSVSGQDGGTEPHVGLWGWSSTKSPDVRKIADKLVGKGGGEKSQLTANDLYRAYKNTPHAPASVFLKYLVHRVNHADAYDDSQRAHQLDKDFLKLVQAGGAAEKCGHLCAADLHQWAARWAPTVVPELVKLRDHLQHAVQHGVGLNVRYIGGQPHVALTRGLNDEVMAHEHPLSSHADVNHLSFGSVKHHSWVPVRDLWYSYELGDRYPIGRFGSENEWLVSNSGPRYQASAEDVRPLQIYGESDGFLKRYGRSRFAGIATSEATDAQLASALRRATDQSDVPPWVWSHPSTGPEFFRAFRDAFPGQELSQGQVGERWVPAEAAVETARRIPYLTGAAAKNPNLSDAQRLYLGLQAVSLQHDVAIREWLKAPGVTSDTVGRLWREAEQSFRGEPGRLRKATTLLSSPLATRELLDEALAGAEGPVASEVEYNIVENVAKNPNHTEEQAERGRKLLEKKYPSQYATFFPWGHAKLSEQTIRDIFKKEDYRFETVAKHNTHASRVLAKLAAEGLLPPEYLAGRAATLGYLEPELQVALLGSIAKRAGVDDRRSDKYILAGLRNITNEVISALALDQREDVRDRLYRNRSVTAEQLREAFPKGLKFPELEPRPGGGVGFQPSGDPIADELAGAYYRRKAHEERKAREHFLRPLPVDVAKSERDLWDASVRGWLASRAKTTGYYYFTTEQRAKNVLRDGAIEPDPTDELLAGEAVLARPATLPALEAWRTEAGPGDVALYFETGAEPHLLEDGRACWDHRVPVERARLADASSAEEPLVKFHPPLRFPRLGVGDDRRETKVAVTPLQRQTFYRAAANIAVRENAHGPAAERLATDPEYKRKVVGAKASDYSTRPSFGVTFQGVAGVGHPGHGKPPATRYDEPGAGTGQSAVSAVLITTSLPPGSRSATVSGRQPASEHENFVGAVASHEDLHRIFSRVQHRYGELARRTLVRNMLLSLPQDLRSAVEEHVSHLRPDLEPGDPVRDEEAVTELGSYLNLPPTRAYFHEKRQDSADQAALFQDRMKRAYRVLQAAAQVADHRWLSRESPWLLDKSEPVLPPERVLEPGEEAAAAAHLGFRPDQEEALEAARWLTGRRVEPDEERFRVAMSLYDGDVARAALAAVGLTDSAANIGALRAARQLGEFGELSKSELDPGTPNLESVRAGAPAAEEAAEEIRRAATAGLVQPLKLGGRHSKGAMAVRDPRTGRVLLLKPGSGKQSPAAGARDDDSSQSAREAAFWHCAAACGMGNYYPRADLVEVGGTQVAAIRMLGPEWRSLDERDRQVDGYAREVLEPYLKRGDVHRLAVVDWVLGNCDSHGQNWLVHAESVAGIDHGSAFAGPNFDPGHDPKSFAPYPLRVFVPGYAKKSPEDRSAALPVLDHEADLALRDWVGGLDAAMLVEVMSAHGVGRVAQEAVVERLSELQRYDGQSLSRHVGELWSGAASLGAKS